MSVNIYDATDSKLKPFVGGTFYAECPIASILPYGGSEPPVGWLLCQGQEVSKTSYADLYTIIGDSFGTASDNTKFVLPDLRESVPKGAGLTSKSSTHMDTDGLAVGEFLNDRIQNITGTLSPTYASESAADINYSGTGAIEGVNNTGAVGLPSSTGSYARWEGFTFDASKVARTGVTTEVKSVGVNYIIKALLTGQPVELSINTTDWNAIEEII